MPTAPRRPPFHPRAIAQQLQLADQASATAQPQLAVRCDGVREHVFAGLRATHPERLPLELLQHTQTLVDRVLFMALAQRRGLVLAEAVQAACPPGPDSWARLCALFRGIQEGRKDRGRPPAPSGLFAANSRLDSLRPTDETLRPLFSLAADDRLASVDVEVWGHLFERSVPHLDSMRAQLDSGTSAAPSTRQRHGVVYTPRPITRYLVEQTLGRTLNDRLQAIFDDIQPVEFDDPKAHLAALVRGWRTYRRWLRHLRVVDPACGSGAFLLAAFDRLYSEYTRIDRTLGDLDGVDHPIPTDVSSTILRHNLFGIDISAASVEVARLSLWLKCGGTDRPLPPLHQTILVGDCLHLDPASFTHSGPRPDTPEHRGFDVVVGNPPYVRHELLTAQKPWLRAHSTVWHGMADLYVYFVERGLQWLRPGGRLGFVLPNKWLKGGYAAPLRRLLSESTVIERIVDFGHAPVFPNTDAFPCILVVRTPTQPKRPTGPFTATTLPRRLSPRHSIAETIDHHAVSIPSDRLDHRPWSLEPPAVHVLMHRMQQHGTRLCDYVGRRPLSGIKTGRQAAFVIDERTRQSLLLQDPASSDLLRPFLRGRDLDRWTVRAPPLHLIFARRGVEIHRYPAILRHLQQLRPTLEPRPRHQTGRWAGRKPGTYAWYELQDAVDYWPQLTQPKIVYEEIQFHPRYALDTRGLFPNNKVFVLPSADPWLLATLNSPLMWWYSWRHLSHMKDDALHTSGTRMVDLPVPPAPRSTEAIDLVYQLQEAHHARTLSTRQLLDWLRTDHGVHRPGSILRSAPGLSLEAFTREASRRLPPGRSPLSPADRRSLQAAHTQVVAAAQVATSAASEARLSELVVSAFGLTPAEVDLVQRTTPPRMPGPVRLTGEPDRGLLG